MKKTFRKNHAWSSYSEDRTVINLNINLGIGRTCETICVKPKEAEDLVWCLQMAIEAADAHEWRKE